MSTALVGVDTHVPLAFEGKIEPNYYCRGWNTKRNKYCRARAGSGTDHVGVGRCRHHLGNAPVKHGRYSAVTQERLQPILAQMQAESPTEKLNVLPELDLARALLVDWINRFEDYAEALLAWHESFDTGDAAPKPRKILDITTLTPLLDLVSKLIHRMHQAASINSIPRRRFLDLMTEIGRALNEEVSNPADLRRIKARIGELRL